LLRPLPRGTNIVDLVAAQSKWIFGYTVASMLLADKKTILRDRLVIFFMDFVLGTKA